MRFVLILALLTGCVHTHKQSAAGAAVLDTPTESPTISGCARLPDVVGHGGGIGDVGVSQAKIVAREAAAEELATHIVWTQPVMQTALGYRGVRIEGAAYRCHAAPALPDG